MKLLRLLTCMLVFSLTCSCTAMAEEAPVQPEPMEEAAILSAPAEAAVEETDAFDLGEEGLSDEPEVDPEPAFETDSLSSEAFDAVEPVTDAYDSFEAETEAYAPTEKASADAYTPVEVRMGVSDRSGNAVSLNNGDTLFINLSGGLTATQWTTGNSKKATVEKVNDHQARVTTRGAGTVVITAKPPKGKNITIKVKIRNPYTPTRVRIEHEALEDKSLVIWTGCKQGLKAKLTPSYARTDLTWKSSNAKIVKVNKRTGSIVGLKPGKAKITVTTSNKKSYAVTVYVVANKVDKITRKPYASEYDDMRGNLAFWLKSVSIDAKGRMTCEVYLINATDKKVTRLNDFTFCVGVRDGGETHPIALHTFAKLKTSCGKRKCKVLKLTFPAADVLQTEDMGTFPVLAYERGDFRLEVHQGTYK